MTFEEAKKILEEEGFYVEKATRPCVLNGWFIKYESPEICEAVQVVCSAGYKVLMFETAFQARKERLKKEYEKNTKAPGPGEEQPKEKKGIIYPTTFPKADFYHKHVLNEGNPALNESDSQFNDALLDEQAKEIENLRDKCKKYAYVLDSVEDKLRKLKAENSRIKNSDLNLEGLTYATRELEEKNKKIAELTKEKSNLEDQITVLNACKKHNDRIDRKQIKCLGKEIARLNGIIHDKNAILSDVAEELRLTKIREKNLAELGLKYVGENEKLKKELADKVVDKIDAQALKSAESALACKEQLIYYKDKIIANNKKKIADLGKELEKMTKLVETVRKGSKEYCDYGIAAGKMIQKMAKVIVNEGPVSSEDFKEYRRLANGGIFMPELSEEELMKLQEKICADIIADDAFEKWLLFGKINIKSEK